MTADSRRGLRALFADRSAVAAVEMALLGPVIALGSILMLDLGYAFNVKLKLTNGVTAAAQYAALNGGSLAGGDVAAFNAKLAAIVTGSAPFRTPPTVTVTYNGVPDGSRAGNYYCLAGSPLNWTSTGTTVAGCGGGVSSGRFVTIEASAAHATLFPNNPMLGSVLVLADRAIVRVP